MIIDTNLDEPKEICDILEKNLFSKDEFDKMTLSGEYKILLYNQNVKLKTYFVKNVLKDKITDIDVHCIKLKTYDSDKEKFVKEISNVDQNAYISYYLVLSFDKISYFMFLFIMKKDINFSTTEDNIAKVQSSFLKLSNSIDTDMTTISNKIKNYDEKYSSELETIVTKQEKIMSSLSQMKEDIDDLLSKVFPSGKGHILL